MSDFDLRAAHRALLTSGDLVEGEKLCRARASGDPWTALLDLLAQENAKCGEYRRMSVGRLEVLAERIHYRLSNHPNLDTSRWSWGTTRTKGVNSTTLAMAVFDSETNLVTIGIRAVGTTSPLRAWPDELSVTWKKNPEKWREETRAWARRIAADRLWLTLEACDSDSRKVKP